MPASSVFFAYEGGHQENADAIKAGIKEFNQHQSSYIAKTWEEMEVSGKIINKCIMQEIDSCSLFACDLTYLNHNVLFELGYAIGRKKNLLILLNDSVDGAKSRYSGFNLLKNVGYESFNNYKHIQAALQKKDRITSVLLDDLVNIDTADHNSYDIFYIASTIQNQASLNLTDMLKDSPYSIIYDNSSEVEYQTLAWYIKSLMQASNIVIHLLGKDKIDFYQKNAEASLYAGIGCGLSKSVLLVAPSPFSAPIDYSDILVQYTDSAECASKAMDWLTGNVQAIVKAVSAESSTDKFDKKLNLLKLGIGCEIAEEEKDALHSYFIEVDAYRKAFERKQSIFVGRKGTGKSAIFIKLEADLDLDHNNYNIILKPDSEELLENLELSELYKSERAKKSFFYTVWKYVFYSKLFLSIYKKAENKTGVLTEESQAKFIDFYTRNSKLLEHNFFGAIREIYRIVDGKGAIDDPSVLEHFYLKIMSELQELVKSYFNSKKYFTINILADNLDKTWNANNDLSIQSEMILSLLEVSGKVEQEIVGKNPSDSKINAIIFLRKDIFDYIRKLAREPDKLTIKSYEIDWISHPNLLKRMIEKRFEYVLNIHNESVSNVWDDYFSTGKTAPFDVIKDIVVLRPRDLIYFISKLFESAVNRDSEIVDNNDFLYAIEAYTRFLHNNLIAEMKAEHPKIEEILSKLQQNYGDNIEYGKFNNIVKDIGYKNEDVDQLLQSLFDKGYMIGVNERTKEVVNDLDTLIKLYNEKWLWLFKKNNIILIPHPDEFFIKYKKSNFLKQ